MTAEDLLQIDMRRWLDLVAPGLIWWHTPNGGQRDAKAGSLLKRMGARAGVPDLVFLLPDGRCLHVEVKTAKGRPTPEQRDLHPRMAEAGHPVHTARSIDDLRAILAEAGVRTREAA